MKKYNFILLLIALNGAYTFGQQEVRVDSRVSQVTVFLNRAQVTREVKARLRPGKNSLILTGLTAQLDPQSIQVSGGGNAVILGINHQQNYLDEFNVPLAIQILKDSVDYLSNQVKMEQTRVEILNKEEQLMISNQKIGGTTQNLTVSELRAMADFYRSRLNEIASERMRHADNVMKINAQIKKMQAQINAQNELYKRNTSEIVINVSTEVSAPIELEVSYIVANAGWHPIYDLRAADTHSPIQLAYKANVFQSTGENWNDVSLRLSTGNPSLGGVKPELSSWFLDFYYPIAYMSRSASGAPSAQKNMVMEDEAMEMMSPVETVANYVSTVQTTLNAEFVLEIPYSITSSSKPTVVDVGNFGMKAEYNYSVAPKLDTDAFLIAKATDWKNFSLLPGEANIFFEGTFVGKTFIDPNAIGDTLSVSLGRDKRIVVKREQQKDFTSTRLIGSNKRETTAWSISIHNTKSEPISITIEDQIPISKNSEIEVDPVNLGGAKQNTNTGKLVWELTLQPGETKSVSYAYEVKYPKDKPVSGL